MRHRILVIDDEAEIGELVEASATGLGFECAATTDAQAFLKMLDAETTMVFLDLMMPEMDGVELLRLMSKQRCQVGIVLMSGVGKRVLETAGQLAEALGLSIVGYLQKPFRLAEVEAVLLNHAAALPMAKSAGEAECKVDESELRLAVERDEFVVHYQPQIDVATGDLIGLEALVRWQHPVRGLIFPDSFIGCAEELGLIDQLGWLVASRGLSELWQFAEVVGRRINLSLNASAYSLHDLRFPDTLVALAERHAVSPGNITIEITETGLIKELSSTLDILTRLRMKQIKLSIDDFGTGYSMMQQLQNVPATELKVDKTFVQRIHASERDRMMVQKTIEIGHETGMLVVGEGVETAEQYEFLKQNHCDAVQGYLYSRPLPAHAMVTWLQAYSEERLSA